MTLPPYENKMATPPVPWPAPARGGETSQIQGLVDAQVLEAPRAGEAAPPGPALRTYKAVDFPQASGTFRRVDWLRPILCQELGLPVLEVRWFVEESEAERKAREATGQAAAPLHCCTPCNGMAYEDEPDRVHLHARLTADQAMETLAHELRHQWQFRGSELPRSAWEDDAAAYAQLILDRRDWSQYA